MDLGVTDKVRALIAAVRAPRLAEGPDAAHRRVIAKAQLKRCGSAGDVR
jgi:hypothetical protein